jgi:hypothetical protein
VYETAVVTFIGSGGFAVAHGRHAYSDTLASNARIGTETAADGDGALTTMDDVDAGGVDGMPSAISSTVHGDSGAEVHDIQNAEPSFSVWTPHKNFQQPAAASGKFLGEVGNSLFEVSDSKADLMGLPRGTSIPWIRGIPDFSDHSVPGPNGCQSVFDVPDMTGDHRKDKILMVRHLAAISNSTPSEVRLWLSENSVVLHHSGGFTVQIVPFVIHKLHHSGAALDLRSRN